VKLRAAPLKGGFIPVGPRTIWCRFALHLVFWSEKSGLTKVVQAQYYRDPAAMDTYLESNHFLTSINNEITDTRNKTYAHNLATLETLVLVLFKRDKTVVPKESAWFGSEVADKEDIRSTLSNGYGDSESRQIQLGATPSPSTTIIPMRQQPLYTEDWIGLRELDKKSAVVLETCEGEHMQLGDCWERLVKKFAGGIPA
jgi:palmitoyl-protein thioesterase